MTIIQDLLTFNQYSRPGTKLKAVKGIVIHYYANPNTTAKNNRDFFENRKLGNTGFGSAHYLIGLEGEIIQAIPDNEMAYHVGAKEYMKGIQAKADDYPNNVLLGIECAHIDPNGKMNDFTFKSLIELTGELVKKYSLKKDNLYLHYDITGKLCHRWFVENPNEWEKFKNLF